MRKGIGFYCLSGLLAAFGVLLTSPFSIVAFIASFICIIYADKLLTETDKPTDTVEDTKHITIETLEDGYVRVLKDDLFIVGGNGGLDASQIEYLIQSLGYVYKTQEAKKNGW